MTGIQIVFVLLGVLAAIAAVGAAVWGWRVKELHAKRRREEAREKIKQGLRRPCRKCGELADPVLNSGNQYRCPSCLLTFTADRHNLIGEKPAKAARAG